MATVLPLPQAIKLKEVNKFDGSPADLSLFDTQIRNSLECLDIPAYHGGCVLGTVAEGYDYAPHSLSLVGLTLLYSVPWQSRNVNHLGYSCSS